MWAVEFQGNGIESLREVERPLPVPGAGQIRLRMTAASINYRDLALIRGEYGSGVRVPLVPLSDGAGVVDAVGEGVRRFRVGDLAIPVMRPLWLEGQPTREAIATSLGLSLDGVLAEYVVVDEAAAVASPSNIDDVEAATLPIAAVTAWTAFEEGSLRNGDSVVIQGTGGVAMFALQFAVARGARAIVTSRSAEKLARAKALGAAEVIDTTAQPRWAERVVELTGGEGADHVLDIGGAATIEQSLDALRPGGNIYLVGFLGGTDMTVSLPVVFRRRAVLRGLSVGSRASFERMNAAIEEHDIHPAIDRVFERTQLADALALMESGGQFGKIAIRL